jgi:hypothetical protein
MAKLRHRGRAVTPRDLEDLALESSPDIAQARALVRGRRTRLVVVMRGDDPAPREAQKRELKRLLLSAAPPSLGRTPSRSEARQLRVSHLRVATLDHAGAVAEAVKTRLAALFDTASGGAARKDGRWARARGRDVAHALIDVPQLLGIARIDLAEVRRRACPGRDARPA